MDREPLYGRDQLLARLMDNYRSGCTLFGLDGVGGVGKTEVAERLSGAIAQAGDKQVVRVDMALASTESLVVAALYEALKQIPKSTGQAVEVATEKALSAIVGNGRKVLAAMAQDLLQAVTDKAEKTIEVVGGLISGENDAPTESLGQLDQFNRRAAIRQFMQIVADLGNPVVVVLDNYEGADASAREFARFIAGNQPAGWILIAACNTETDPSDWNSGFITTVEGLAGVCETVHGLDREGIRQWHIDQVGNDPSDDLLSELHEKSLGGRPVWLELLIKGLREGVEFRLPSVNMLHAARRNALSSPARAVAEMLSIIPPDKAVPIDFLALACRIGEIGEIGGAIDELRLAAEIQQDASHVRFANSSYRNSWFDSIGPAGCEQRTNIWYRAFEESGRVPQLLSTTGLVPAIAGKIASGQSQAVTDVAGALLQLGAQEDALVILDAAWQHGQYEAGKGDQMIEHALIAAQTRLDLGRYSDVQPALRLFELGQGSESQRLKADLIQMKLALRLNTYEAVWAIGSKLTAAGLEPEDEIERELVLNTAYRDLLDLDALKSSVARIRAFRLESGSNQLSVTRALARSLSKLGLSDEAMAMATEASTQAAESGDIRAIGNAHLAMAEALRHAGRQAEAIEHYRRGAQLANACGNRDSLIWCNLGEACAFVEQGQFESASDSLAVVDFKVNEMGYEHPLEKSHAQLIRTILALVQGQEVEIDPILTSYRRLGVAWPEELLRTISKTRVIEAPIPI
ncbi:AAA family ATPase [Sphingomonas alba]|uniref:AAA family ATPase n=1 Tax=Sphingomonas alba TaxID=2908208 RepID=A0ABT0RN86_9SPHN|nr:AAA family ATPase [Sphingomonas alba]MCL6684114.1 AAA family ATPase [Sphingomonas alba]